MSMRLACIEGGSYLNPDSVYETKGHLIISTGESYMQNVITSIVQGNIIVGRLRLCCIKQSI